MSPARLFPTRVGSEIPRRTTPATSRSIHPTRVGLRAAKPPRAEESAPTTWGAKIMDWVVRAPHAWGNPCNAWFCAAGCGSTSDFTSRFRLHAFYFIYPTRVGYTMQCMVLRSRLRRDVGLDLAHAEHTETRRLPAHVIAWRCRRSAISLQAIRCRF